MAKPRPKIEPIYRRLANRICELRLERELTQQAVADRMGVSRTSYDNLEQARQRVSLHVAANVAAALGIHPRELLAKLWP